MRVIGLCGGSGSGKGVVARLLSEYGFAHIDTDKIYHDITDKPSPCLDELVDVFGKKILNLAGGLDRPSLAEIVFNSQNKDEFRKQLNEIAHRHVLFTVRKLLPTLKSAGYKAALVDAPLLFESCFDKECDLILAVIAPREVRIKRICERDGISPDAAERRIASQLSDEFLLSRADFCLTNDSDIASLRSRCEGIVKKIINYV